MGKEKYTRILWLDLEATGSGDAEDILEIGAVMTDLDLNVLDQFQRVYSTRKSLLGMAPVVQEMHTKNGLWGEVQQAKLDFPDGEREFLNWLGGDKNHILLAGSGVSHYDRRYIKRDWPSVDKRLTYYSLDIGVVRRAFRILAGIQLENTKDENHRAFGDVLNCIEEAKRYRDILKLAKEADEWILSDVV